MAATVVTVPYGGLPGPPVTAALRDRVESTLVPAEAIASRVRELAAEIHDAYPGVPRIVMLVVLKGAFVFAADLGRAIQKACGPEVEFQFVRTSTYGAEMKQDGEEQRAVSVSHLPESLLGHHVLLVDDLIDQGFTLQRLLGILAAAGATSLKVCTLLAKQLRLPSQRVAALRRDIQLDFVGFELPDRWVSGYGIDAGGEDLRCLPEVVAINQGFYRTPGFSG